LSKEEFHSLGQLLRPSGRQEAGLLLIPGFKCGQEFVAAGGRIELLVLDPDHVEEIRLALGEEAWTLALEQDVLRQARPHELARLADQPNPEGLVLAGRPPHAFGQRPVAPPQLVLDGVQDPGNLGSMLRTALWFGMDRVWLTTPCADAWSPRAIRSSMGAVFHMTDCRSLAPGDLVKSLGKWPVRLLGLDAASGTSLGEHVFSQEDVLVLGSESHGLRLPEKALHTRLRIPGAGLMESLNVGHAMAVCAWQRWQGLHGA